MSTDYHIRHDLEFRYGAPVHGSAITLFVCPTQGQRQFLRGITIDTDPGGTVFEFDGPFGNRGHFFDRHARHRFLAIRVRSTVEVTRSSTLPADLDTGGWKALQAATADPELSLMLQSSRFARMSPALERFVAAHGIGPGSDPLESVRELRSTLFRVFEYAPGSTTADSPIEHVLESGRGVCQDYVHVMASITRYWGIPTRYVSGYLGPGQDHGTHGESHAWVECWLPGPGWSGFDPANDCECDDRHVRVAVGRDYADVPPVRGTFLGNATSLLTAHVAVTRRDAARNNSEDSRIRTTFYQRSTQ